LYFLIKFNLKYNFVFKQKKILDFIDLNLLS